MNVKQSSIDFCIGLDVCTLQKKDLDMNQWCADANRTILEHSE